MKTLNLTLILFTFLFFSCSDNTIQPEDKLSDNTQMEQNISSEDNNVNYSPTGWIIIDTLPYTITQPGSYKVKKNLVSAGGLNGIIVSNTDHVTINLNDYLLTAAPSASVVPVGITVTNSSFVLIYNGDINGYKTCFTFTNSVDCSAKQVEYTPGAAMTDVPPHYSGVKITNSPRIQVSWSVFNNLDNALEITGSLSSDCKFLSNTCYGNPNPSTGRPTGIRYHDTLSSPSNNLVRNNLFTGFSYGYNIATKNGDNKTNSNTFEYFLDKGFNNDPTNIFKYNTYTQLTP